jgi:hypothetical protein
MHFVMSSRQEQAVVDFVAMKERAPWPRLRKGGGMFANGSLHAVEVRTWTSMHHISSGGSTDYASAVRPLDPEIFLRYGAVHLHFHRSPLTIALGWLASGPGLAPHTYLLRLYQDSRYLFYSYPLLLRDGIYAATASLTVRLPINQITDSAHRQITKLH